MRLLLLALLLVIECFSQDPRGRLLGRVIDSSGAVVPGIPVTLTNLETGVVLNAQTNAQGNYLILYINPGRYRLSAELSGFKRFENPGIEVRVGDALTVDITMEPGALSESVTVTAETPLLQSSEASIGQLVDTKRLTELPLAGGNPLYLLQLTPGIIATNASSHGWFPHALDSISQVAAVGTRTRSNQFALDGNPIMTQGGQVSYSPPPEMIQEMKIDTVPYDAALGGFSGANFNIVTKAGTNQYHGDLWFSHYSRPLTTRNFFVNRFIFDPTTGPITEEKKKSQWPPVLTNRYRATASGPLIRNRTFLVYGYDRLDRKRPVTGNNTVPTELQRNGDFSQLLALGSRYQIFDPSTIRAEAGGRFSRQPYAGNRIPVARIDPVAKALLNFYPLPNNAENPEGRNNFIAPIGTRIDYFSHSARLDHTFNEKHRVFGSMAYSNLDEPGGRRFPDNLAVGQVEDRQHRGLSLDDVLMLNASTVLNLRYGFTRYLNNLGPDSAGMDLAALGFSPVLLRQIDPTTSALPAITIQGLQGLSQNSGYISATNYHTLTGNVSYSKGNRTYRFGGEMRVFQENRTGFGNVAPSLDFQAAWTRGPLDNSPTSPIGQGLASFLVGLPTGGGKDINASYAQQSRFFGLFFQNDWRVTPRLTLNMGLRYELETPIVERYNRTVRGFDFDAPNPISDRARANYATAPIPELPVGQFRTAGGLLFSGVGSVPRGLWRTDRNNFAPRLGFAWTVTPRTVLRGGFGMYYELLGASYNDVNQQGFSQRTSVVPSLDNGLTFRATLANPLPDGALQPAAASGGLLTFVGRAPGFFDPTRRNGYMQRWSFGVQRELPGRIVVETMYVGNRGTLLGVDRDLSAVPGSYYSRLPVRDQDRINFMTANVPNPFFGIPTFDGSGLAARNITRAQLLTPFPHFSALNTTDDIGYSWYHSLQAQFNKRFSHGMTLGASYTWSKFMEAVELLNAFDPTPVEVISPQDRPHHISVTGIYELPVGRGRRWMAKTHPVLDGIAGGWQVQAIYQWMVGPPIGFGNVIYNGASLNDIKVDNPTAERWFNTTGFERDPARQLEWNARAFPLRLSGLRADGFNQWDISLIKTFRITEKMRFQLRAEAQNALNHAMFAAPNTAPANTLFGQVNATQFPEQRRITLAGKLSF
ncbi:MAG: TonB-dependent receptor [Bryobacterales bacterium]|nr:TonB-dependent receptor [Bryobacterales bacterium]